MRELDKFKLVSSYKPTGDQPEAIAKLTEGLNKGLKEQVLLGVTGSGKTFTMANIIANVNRPTLVLAHNKTLAAQLCSEFKELFPENAVEYFVSYYDYYQPEAYIPGTDTYRTLRARNARTGVMFILPFIIGFLMFMLRPLIQSFIMSLSAVNISEAEWPLVGL